MSRVKLEMTAPTNTEQSMAEMKVFDLFIHVPLASSDSYCLNTVFSWWAQGQRGGSSTTTRMSNASIHNLMKAWYAYC